MRRLAILVITVAICTSVYAQRKHPYDGVAFEDIEELVASGSTATEAQLAYASRALVGARVAWEGYVLRVTEVPTTYSWHVRLDTMSPPEREKIRFAVSFTRAHQQFIHSLAPGDLIEVQGHIQRVSLRSATEVRPGLVGISLTNASGRKRDAQDDDDGT